MECIRRYNVFIKTCPKYNTKSKVLVRRKKMYLGRAAYCTKTQGNLHGRRLHAMRDPLTNNDISSGKGMGVLPEKRIREGLAPGTPAPRNKDVGAVCVMEDNKAALRIAHAA
jgi:hypothetical protein